MESVRIKIVLFCLLGLAPFFAKADDVSPCGNRYVGGGTIFTLTIFRSFDATTEFKVCEKEKIGYLVVNTYKSEALKSAGKPSTITIENKRYDRVLGLYEEALAYDARDNAMGFDGSSWCLETERGGAYSKACFWSPDDETRKRRLTGLKKLGEELWSLAGFKGANGRLY